MPCLLLGELPWEHILVGVERVYRVDVVKTFFLMRLGIVGVANCQLKPGPFLAGVDEAGWALVGRVGPSESATYKGRHAGERFKK